MAAILVVGLVLVNYLASSLPVRVDATAEQIYTISPGRTATELRRKLAPDEDPSSIEVAGRRLDDAGAGARRPRPAHR